MKKARTAIAAIVAIVSSLAVGCATGGSDQLALTDPITGIEIGVFDTGEEVAYLADGGRVTLKPVGTIHYPAEDFREVLDATCSRPGTMCFEQLENPYQAQETPEINTPVTQLQAQHVPFDGDRPANAQRLDREDLERPVEYAEPRLTAKDVGPVPLGCVMACTVGDVVMPCLTICRTQVQEIQDVTPVQEIHYAELP